MSFIFLLIIVTLVFANLEKVLTKVVGISQKMTNALVVAMPSVKDYEVLVFIAVNFMVCYLGVSLVSDILF